MRTSYHVHTYISDGQCDAADHVKAAVAAGLDELGISDHYTPLPGKDIVWSMPLSGVADYLAAIEAAKKQAGSLAVRLGIEVDYIPESVETIARMLSRYPFDYVIGSVHFVGAFPVDAKPDDWEALSQDRRNEIIREYWGLIREMAETRLFDIAGHLDLYKKFGHGPTIDVSADIASALDAIAEADMAVEVNVSGLFKACAEPYPSLSILKECCRRGIASLVTTDAHKAEDLVRGYEVGVRMLRDAGYTQQSVFASRSRATIAL